MIHWFTHFIYFSDDLSVNKDFNALTAAISHHLMLFTSKYRINILFISHAVLRILALAEFCLPIWQSS